MPSTKPEAIYFRKRYNSDPKFREYNKKRHRVYSRSEHGKKVKRSCYDKYMETEHGYMTDKWNNIKGRSRDTRRPPIPVEVTKEEFFELWEKHKKRYGGWVCAYTGKQMTHIRSINPTGVSSRKSKKIQVKSNMSIDRIDSDKGYTKDNIVFCTWDFNDRKGNISLEDIRCILNLLESKKHEVE